MTLTSTSATAPDRALIARVRATNPSADVLTLCNIVERFLNVLDGTKPVVKPKLSHQANANALKRKRARRQATLTVAYPQQKS